MTVLANRNSFGEAATCTLPVTVVPISMSRLQTLAGDYRDSGAIAADIAAELLEREIKAFRADHGCG